MARECHHQHILRLSPRHCSGSNIFTSGSLCRMASCALGNSTTQDTKQHVASGSSRRYGHLFRSQSREDQESRQNTYLSVQHMESDIIICPFTGSIQVERAHILSHSPSKHYRTKTWLRMLGFSDALLAPGALMDVNNMWPVERNVHKLLDKARAEVANVPTEETSIEVIRLTELACVRSEKAGGPFRPSVGDFLRGWQKTITIDGNSYPVFRYELGFCLPKRKFDLSGFTYCQKVLQCVNDGHWPIKVTPTLARPLLPLNLTFVELMLINWCQASLGPCERP